MGAPIGFSGMEGLVRLRSVVVRRKKKPVTDREVRSVVYERAGGYCELTMSWRSRGLRYQTLCVRRAMPGMHHLKKRSQGGAQNLTPEMAMRICAFHHDLADNASYGQTSTSLDGETRRGRLVIAPGTFVGRMVTRPRRAQRAIETIRL